MASSAFSFHCMICFEEFDPQTNYPVVLPCGHTYVCIECANRLDKCMECRMPLTMKVELPPPPPPSPSTVTPGSSTPTAVAFAAAGGGVRSKTNSSLADAQKENYADRVRNSPGFRRRYGHRNEYYATTNNASPFINKRANAYNHHHSAVNNAHPTQAQQQQSHLHHHHHHIQKQRLPLPKNAVLLSLIQASEPARRRAEVEAPRTPQKNDDESLLKSNSNSGSETPSPGNRHLPKFSRPSPLFLNSSSCGEQPHPPSSQHASFEIKKNNVAANNKNLMVGSLPDDEEHKIRVGTYLEGGPCGTYAVAVRGGLLVYPTLFEHTLPSVLNGWTKRRGGKGGGKAGCDDEVDVVKRDVEELVKKHRASAGRRTFPGSKMYDKDVAAGRGAGSGSSRVSGSTTNTTPGKQNNAEKKNRINSLLESVESTNWHGGLKENDTTQLGTLILNKNGRLLRGGSPVTTELGVSHTWVECHNENNENFEAMFEEATQAPHCGVMEGIGEIGCACTSTTSINNSIGDDGNDDDVLSLSSPLQSPAGASIPMMSMRDNEEDEIGTEFRRSRDWRECMSDPGGPSGGSYVPKLDQITAIAATQHKIAAIAATASSSEFEDENDDDDVAGLIHSLTISDEEDLSINDEGGNRIGMVDISTRTLPARHSRTIIGVATPSSPLTKDDASGTITKKIVRHFSQGYKQPRGVPSLSQSQHYRTKKSVPDGDGGGGDKENNVLDEFDRPLIRLKYGDRVQVVSMDLRGWVKLARGYGYIRLENDKQLVKVGGTSDKACQIESMLHELSIERNRLKHEQTKLERLSAGLMIDLQMTLITSDDHVVVPAPEGSLQRTDSEMSLSILGTGRKLDTSNPNMSIDDIDVSTRRRAVLSPPKSINEHCSNNQQQLSSDHPHRLIRTAKSHSPGRTHTTPKAPPSPPYGQVISNISSQHTWSNINTPTRVNFRTGLSGHRALSSSHSHPHDFLGGALRSMSNHAGISSSKKTTANSRGRSIY